MGMVMGTVNMGMGMVKRVGVISLGVGLLLGLSACGGEEAEVQLTPNQEKAVSERLAPAGEVTLESDVVASAPAIDRSASAEPRSGEEIYNKSCTTCHAVGAAGAPKLGVVEDWSDRIAKGMETLYEHSINGFKGMPPRGLCMDCTDEEVKASVDYMVAESQ